MSFLKRNCTIVILGSIIMLMFAVNALAVAVAEDWYGLQFVTILQKEIRGGAAPLTDEAILKTSSAEHEHKSYTSIGCYICGEWITDESTNYSLQPERARASKYYPSSCWTGGQGHCTAIFDAILKEDPNN